MDYLIGFVQELVMNDDPEHQWIEKIRTSRASNEARQRLFSRLSGMFVSKPVSCLRVPDLLPEGHDCSY